MQQGKKYHEALEEHEGESPTTQVNNHPNSIGPVPVSSLDLSRFLLTGLFDSEGLRSAAAPRLSELGAQTRIRITKFAFAPKLQLEIEVKPGLEADLVRNQRVQDTIPLLPPHLSNNSSLASGELASERTPVRLRGLLVISFPCPCWVRICATLDAALCHFLSSFQDFLTGGNRGPRTGVRGYMLPPLRGYRKFELIPLLEHLLEIVLVLELEPKTKPELTQ